MRLHQVSRTLIAIRESILSDVCLMPLTPHAQVLVRYDYPAPHRNVPSPCDPDFLFMLGGIGCFFSSALTLLVRWCICHLPASADASKYPDILSP